jgi:hypothetical protein
MPVGRQLFFVAAPRPVAAPIALALEEMIYRWGRRVGKKDCEIFHKFGPVNEADKPRCCPQPRRAAPARPGSVYLE